MKTFWRIIACLLVVIGPASIATFCYYVSMQSTDDITMQLPEFQGFQGRKFVNNEIHPGTFSIERPFSQIDSWGKDAIMLCQAKDFSNIVEVDVWRPDATTPGTFEHAKVSYAFPLAKWHSAFRARIVNDGKTAILSQEPSAGVVFVVLALFVVSVVCWFCVKPAWGKAEYYRRYR